MNYQLVLQFRGEALQRFFEIGDFENSLQATPGLPEMFDGIDQSAHVANLFFYTDNPAETFQTVRSLLDKKDEQPGFAAAYRTIAEDNFRILWPKDVPTAFALR